MVRGVLFDMDGTMLDTEPISMACWRKSAAHFGITIDDELMEDALAFAAKTGRHLISKIID